jgi:hypothetical protein
MINLAGPFNSGLAVGADGSATANADTGTLRGKVLAIYVRYNGSPPAGTTDAVVATAGVNHPAVTLLTLANGATDGWRYPRTQIQTTAGVGANYAATFPIYEPIPIHDEVNVLIDDANAGDSIDVWLLLED